jgi:ABC-type transport system substrate-binding protein
LALVLLLPSFGARAQAPDELRVAVDDFAGEFLDPILGSYTSFSLLDHMYDSFIEVAPGGTLEPGVVEKWEVAPDKLSYIFHLRHDVVFHDGTKLTAEDVKFSIERTASTRARDRGKQTGIYGDPPRVEVLDPYTVRVYTNGPQPDLLAMARDDVRIYPKAYIEKNGDKYFEQHPIGSGPYKFVSMVAGDRMDFEAVDYPHWRVGAPDFKHLTIYQVPEEATRVAMLKSGQLDEAPISLATAQSLKNDKDITIVQGPIYYNMLFIIGSDHPNAKGMPLSDVRVRQALSLAINRKELVDTLFGGIGDSSPLPKASWETPEVSIWPPEIKVKWKAWIEQNYRYDPEEARRLIKEAGYPDGFDFTFWVTPDPEFPAMADLAQALVGYWEKVGARCTLVNVDTATYKANRNTKKSDKLIGRMGADSDAYPLNQPSAIHSWERWTSDQGSMDMMVGNQEFLAKFDPFFNEAASEMNMEKRALLLDKVMDMIMPHWTYFDVVGTPSLFAFGPRVKPYMPLPFHSPAEFYANWKRADVD